MMTERVKMRYVSCPSCGKQLFKVAGNCSVEITCVRCKKEIVGVVDEIYMKIFENCRGKEHDQEKASRYSTCILIRHCFLPIIKSCRYTARRTRL